MENVTMDKEPDVSELSPVAVIPTLFHEPPLAVKSGARSRLLLLC